jgi:hypothetical protein
MLTVYSLNTLCGQSLVSGSASTFLLKTYDLILDVFLLSQHKTYSLSQCVWHEHMTRCHRSIALPSYFSSITEVDIQCCLPLLMQV